MVMLSTTYELLKYVTPDQLPVEFGGNFIYDHKTWLRNRMVSFSFYFVSKFSKFRTKLILCSVG